MSNYYSIEKKLRIKEEAAREKIAAICDLLGWAWVELDTGDIVARVPMSAFGMGETITVSFRKKNHISIESESVWASQFFDFGKNESNVDKFLEIFEKAKMPLDQSEYADEAKRGFFSRYFSGR